jgi:hypothetical protein
MLQMGGVPGLRWRKDMVPVLSSARGQQTRTFAQPFLVGPNEQFEVIARAASVDKPESIALIQINWHDGSGAFIAVSQHYFKVTSAERTVHHTVVAPPEAKNGTLYVVPGGPGLFNALDAVRAARGVPGA